MRQFFFMLWGLTLTLAIAGAQASTQQSWPIMYAYSPDSMPIMEVRLAPPRKPLPEVTGTLGELEKKMHILETDGLLNIEAAYNASLGEASKSLPALVDRLMHVFVKPSAWIAAGRRVVLDKPGHLKHAPSFREVRGSGGHEVATRINVLPVASPDASLEPEIEALERKRSDEEAALFKEAEDEMAMLTNIVEMEAEAEITQEVNGFIHAQKYGLSVGPGELLQKAGAMKFLALRQPVLSSGPQLTTNVRVAASDEPFPTIASMVEDLGRKRDASEGLTRARLQELQLQLLQAENAILSDRLQGWVEHILQTSV